MECGVTESRGSNAAFHLDPAKRSAKGVASRLAAQRAARMRSDLFPPRACDSVQPHYGRLEQNSDEWIVELEQINADVLLVGHSHVPFVRRVGDKLVVNPGSVGQPRSGDAQAS